MTTALIAQRLDALLARPNGWGSPESVELQALLLVELRHAAAGAPDAVIDGTRDRYLALLDREAPGHAATLAGRLGLTGRADDRFVAVLRRFAANETPAGEPAPVTSLADLQPGDTIRHRSGADAYIVTGNYGTHVTAARTVDVTQPGEWVVVARGGR